MAKAARDVNRIPTLIGVSTADGATPILVEIDPDTGEVLVKTTVASLSLPSGAATSAKQLPDNHQVTVSNPTADPETGLATSANQLADGHNVQINALSVIYAGTKTVPTGTAEAIAGSQAIHSVTVKALSTNTVAVYVGGTGITVSGFELLAGESVSLDVSNLATVFVISGSASQVVRYIGV